MFSELYRLMGMMVLLMGAGFLMRKTGIITPEGKKCLTDIILYAILPCNIIKAFSREMEAGFWSTFFMVLLMAVLAQVVSFCFPGFCTDDLTPEKNAYISMHGLFQLRLHGQSLAEGVFGETGLLYASIFLIPQRIVMWTAGVSVFRKRRAERRIPEDTHPSLHGCHLHRHGDHGLPDPPSGWWGIPSWHSATAVRR